MRQLVSIAWKEWHEARIFLWIALGVFIGLPAVGALEYTIQFSRHFVIDTTPWVLAFGGVLAVFVGVGITCRDFSGHLEDFWRSRPLGVSRWLATKYAVGLLVVLAAAILPLLIQKWINPLADPAYGNDLVPLLITLPVILLVIYSVGFLSGCVVRRTAHAAAMAFTAILLIYFLIFILPPVGWLRIAWITADFSSLFYLRMMDQSYLSIWFLYFAGPLLTFGMILLLISLVAVRRGWHVESGRRLLYGSVSSALLALIASVGVQLGSNLPVLYQADVPDHERITLIRCDGHSGFVLTYRPRENVSPGGVKMVDSNPQFFMRTITLSANGVTFGEAKHLGYYWQFDPGSVSSPLHPDVQYRIQYSPADRINPAGFELVTTQFDQDRFRPPLHLWDHTISSKETSPGRHYGDARDTAPIYLQQDRLYVLGERLVILDISQPLTPRIISDVPFINAFGVRSMSDSGELVLQLPQVPDLSPRQRLEATAMSRQILFSNSLEGDTLCVDGGSSIFEYHLTKLTDTTATFQTVARHDSTLLQRLFGANFQYGNIKMVNGFLYQGEDQTGRFEAVASRSLFNGRMTVFDTRGDNPMHVAGHFAAPGADVICPLPDGRALVGGDKIWLIASPVQNQSN